MVLSGNAYMRRKRWQLVDLLVCAFLE